MSIQDNANPTKTLAVAITTFNSIRTIRECLDSVRGIADKIYVVDSGSTDGTVELCHSYGAEVEYREWPGMVKQRQFSIDRCHDYRWVLSLDSDESLDDCLAEAVREAAKLDAPHVHGYKINRKVWFMDGWLNYVFQPEPRLRLVRPDNAKVVGVGVHGKGGHDSIVVEGQTALLHGTCKHDSWKDPTDMMRRYVELGHRAMQYDPRPSNQSKLFLSPINAFIKQYFFKKGFLDGRRGLIASLGVAYGTGIKHLLKNSHQVMQEQPEVDGKVASNDNA
jgi:glycosyltransferase involved in cell wall biosynthesis